MQVKMLVTSSHNASSYYEKVYSMANNSLGPFVGCFLTKKLARMDAAAVFTDSYREYQRQSCNTLSSTLRSLWIPALIISWTLRHAVTMVGACDLQVVRPKSYYKRTSMLLCSF